LDRMAKVAYSGGKPDAGKICPFVPFI